MSNFSNLRSQSDKSDQLRLFQVCGVSLHRRGGATALKGLGSDKKLWHKNWMFFFAPKRRQSYKVAGWLLGWCHGLQVLDLAANKGPCWLIMHCFLSRPLEDRKRFVDERAKFHALALRWEADLWSWSCWKILDPLWYWIVSLTGFFRIWAF